MPEFTKEQRDLLMQDNLSIFDGAVNPTDEQAAHLEALNKASIEAKPVNNAIVSGGVANIAAAQAMRRKTRPIVRDYKKIRRNDPCPCGKLDENGKPMKYKNCCLSSGKYETVHEV